MNPKKTFSDIISKLPFSGERVICRIVAAWISFVAIGLIGKKGFAQLSFAQDTPFYLILIWTAIFFAFFTLFAALLPKFHTDSWFLLLSSLCCVVCWLWESGKVLAAFDFNYENDNTPFFFLLAIILAFGMIVVYCIARNTSLLDKIKVGSRLSVIISGAFAFVGAVVIALISCLRYKTFSSPNFDFGIFCQSFHYMKTTGLPLVTCERDVLLSHFAVHFSPIYYVLLPFYAIFPSPITLQISQAIVSFSAVILIILLCRHYNVGKKSTVIICFIYSFYPALSCGCMFDFHENCFIVTLLLWMFLFYEKEKWVLMYVSVLSVLMVKEDAAFYVMIFAIYIIISKKRFLHGALTAVFAIAWFLVVTAILNNSAGYWAEYYKSIGETPNPAIAGVMIKRFDNLIYYKDEGLIGAIKTILVNPGFVMTQVLNSSTNGVGKIVYLIEMILPLGFIPFVTKKTSRWLLLTPLLVNLLTMYLYQYNIGFQYSFGITAFLFWAMIQNTADMSPGLKRNLLAIGAVACLCTYLLIIPPYLKNYEKKWSEEKDKFNRISEVLETLPDDASLNVSSHLVPHVSDHDTVYEIYYHGDAPDVDYVVYYYPYLDAASRDKYLENGYTVYKDVKDELLILQKGSDE